MKICFRGLGFTLVPLLLPPPVLAHHSNSMFDLDSRITFEGVVTRYEWRNPHVYLYVEGENDNGELVEWAVEAEPPSLMARRGWSRESFEPGDLVSVEASPYVNDSRAMAYGRSIRRADGTLMDVRNLETLEQGTNSAPTTATGLSGTWLTPFDSEVSGQFFFGNDDWALTSKGREAVDGFDESVNPGLDCVPRTAPVLMLFPALKRIEVGEDVTVIRAQPEGAERTIHMNADTHEGASYTLQGHSIGRWEGDVLVVDTTHFAEHRLGNGSVLPSGRSKHLVERFALDPDRRTLTYRLELEDPEYIVGKVTATVNWVYRPDLEFEPEACDVENARRYR